MIVFQNKGEMDLRGLRIHGLSAKEHAVARGQFGTGLKHALSVIMRLGGKVKIQSGMTSVDIFAEKGEFRGKEYHEVWAQPENEASFPLGFTTNLGKSWEPWMAYRELWSNCEDEKGHTFSVHGSMDAVKKAADLTSIIVACEAIREVHTNSADVIIPDAAEPLWSSGDVDVHEGESEYVFYRGIRAFKLKNKAAHRYNIKRYMELTEDRTIKWTWMIDDLIRDAIICSPEKAFVERSFSGEYEQKIDYEEAEELGEPFRAAAYSTSAPEKANRAALRIPDPELPTTQVKQGSSEILKSAIEKIEVFNIADTLRSRAYVLGAAGGEVKTDVKGRIVIPQDQVDDAVKVTSGLLLLLAREQFVEGVPEEKWLATKLAEAILER